MPKTVEQRLDDAAPALRDIAEKYGSAACRLVSLRDELLRVCDTHMIVTTATKMCTEVGFHPKNRGTRGITPQDVQRKTSIFCRTGFSPSECERALLVRRIPGSVGDQYEEANRLAAEQSIGALAPVARGTLDSFTLTCNHTFQSFRSVSFGAASEGQ